MAVVLLDEAKAALNLNSSADDVELSMYLDAADDVVSNLIGPVTATPFTDLIEPAHGVSSYPSGTYSTAAGPSAWRGFTLAHTPVQSLTSVTGAYSGAVYSTAGLLLEGTQGLVRPAAATAWPWWEPVLVAYVAGWVKVPAAARLAALVIIEHLWQTQRAGGVSASPFAPESPGQPHGLGYAIPPRALELLAPFRLAPRVA